MFQCSRLLLDLFIIIIIIIIIFHFGNPTVIYGFWESQMLSLSAQLW